MAEQPPDARKQSRFKRDQQQKAERGTGQNGQEEEAARYEQELVGYLQERIKPGLNSGAIPLLVRSIAKEIAHREPVAGAAKDAEAEQDRAEAEEKPSAERNDEPSAGEADAHAEEGDDQRAEAEDEPDAESNAPPDFEADMRELQAELGEDWILRFSVQGDDGWLTAEKEDGSQHLEAPTASVLLDAVDLLDQDGGRSG